MVPQEDRPISRLAPLRSATFRFGALCAVLGAVAVAWSHWREVDSGLLASAGPTALALGFSLAAGFLIGWLLRRVRTAAIAGMALLAAALYALQHFGLLEDSFLRDGVVHAGDQALEGASRVKELASEYLPSGAAAGLGGILGYWAKGS